MLSDESTHQIAIIGITGALGREIEAALEVEHEGIARLFPVAGPRSAGQIVHWRGTAAAVTGAAELDPREVDFAVFAAPPEIVSQHAPRLLMAGARVIDASGVLAAPPLPRPLSAPAPVVWPRLSSFSAVDLAGETALALPSSASSTLAGLLDALTLPDNGLPALERVSATVLLSASHAGQPGIEALSRQTVGLLNSQPALAPEPFPAVLAFNAVLPPPEETVLFESRIERELRRLVPRLADVPVDLMPIWIAAFSGVVASVDLRFAADVDPAAFARLADIHPDLGRGDVADVPDDDDVPITPDEPPQAPVDGGAYDDEDGDGDDDEDGALSLRTVLDSDRIHLGTPLFGPRSMRLVLMADPIHRTAQTTAALLKRWFEALA